MDMDDLVCVVGMACRLPGGINSPTDLWEFLMSKRSAQGPVPKMRFDIDGFYEQDENRAGALNAAGGYFLSHDTRQFDNSFFGINNLEATSMDPQQRQLLEVVFECFEHAGVTVERASGSNIGVYVGNFTVDHQTAQTRDPDSIHRYTATGCGTTILANRISHVFDLHGPSLTLDTACSSSLYCLHTAVNSIKSGDCDSAIVAGVNLIMSPEQCLGTFKAGVLSPTSTCHTFDASADGYGRAEGVNAVYLKKYSEAVGNGDRVWAIIRGTAVNANGKTSGITQPSADLQEAVIRKAYSNAKLGFADTDYVECHGTGTPVGDPIEVDAISRCFSREGAPLMIGSSKPNLGHSEAASGLTALIKVILALEYGKIPPTYGLNSLNPRLKLQSRNIEVVRNVQEWPRPLRRASVNAFGYGGANAHAILETAVVHNPVTYDGQCSTQLSRASFVLPVSAASVHSLKTRVDAVKKVISLGDSNALGSLAWTLAERRSHLSTRRVLFVEDEADGSVQITESEDTNTPSGSSNIPATVPLGLVFTGQGAQHPGMARGLLEKNWIFSKTIRALDEVLQSLPYDQAPEWTLEQTILDSSERSQINHVTRSQPVCTAVQIALVDLLHSWGIEPSAGVVGHSSGEIAAAYATGALTATQAILVAYFRGYAVGHLRTCGSMVAASISFEEAERLLDAKGLIGEVCVACVNSPESVTLSGSPHGIDILVNEIQGIQQKFARKLLTDDKAYHSHLMTEAGGLYEDLISPHFAYLGQGKSTTRWKFFSTVVARGTQPEIFEDCIQQPTYWRRNLEMPVQFHYAIERLLANQTRIHLVEIGPHAALRGPLEQIRKDIGRAKDVFQYDPTLMRGIDADASMKGLAGRLYLHGYVLNWRNVNFASHAARSKPVSFAFDTPPYPWDHSAGLLWDEPRGSAEIRCRQYPRHELLGSRQVAGNDIDWSWRNILRLEEVPWLRHHKLDGKIVLPAACYLAMAMEALKQIRPLTEQADCIKSFQFQRVSLNAALVVPDKADGDQRVIEIHTVMSAQRLSTTTTSGKWYEFSISSWTSGNTVTHCTGRINACVEFADAGDRAWSTCFGVEKADGFEEWTSMQRWYEKFQERGLSFGPSFQSIMSLKTDADRHRREALCNILLDPPAAETVREQRHSRYPFHPVTIDACFQLAIMSATAGNVNDLRVCIPVFIEECRFNAVGRHDFQERSTVHARATKSGILTERIDSSLYNASGLPIIHFQRVKMSQFMAKTLDPTPSRQPCYRVRWKPDLHQVSTGVQEPLTQYLQAFRGNYQDAESESSVNEETANIAGLLDLLGHKNPRMRVLELEAVFESSRSLLQDVLGNSPGFQTYQSWHKRKLDEGELSKNHKDGDSFEVVLALGVSIKHSDSGSSFLNNSSTNTPAKGGQADSSVPLQKLHDVWKRSAESIICEVAHWGSIITHKTIAALDALNDAHFTVLEVATDLILAIRPELTVNDHSSEKVLHSWQGKDVVIVKRKSRGLPTSMDFGSVLATHLRQNLGAAAVMTIDFGEGISQIQWKDTVCISLLELDREFLPAMNQHDMDILRSITNRVRTLIWVTGATMLGNSPSPSLALSNGLSRTLMLEQPALNFFVLDVGPIHMDTNKFISEPEVLATCQNIVKVIQYASNDNSPTHDKEFVQQDGLLHVSRLLPDLELNSLFQRRLSSETCRTEDSASFTRCEKMSLESARPARLAIDQVGVSESIHFQQLREPSSPPGVGFIDVLVRAVSLNAKDVYALNGRIETSGATVALEFSGVVTATGPDVSDLQPGDAVLVLAPCHFSTTERVPAWAAHKMLPGEEHCVVSTLPVIFSTALHALRDRGKLRAGESVLIHCGAGAFGLAAIALAQRMGAVVYTTASSAERRAFVANHFGLPEGNVFQSRDTSFAGGIRLATGGRGVDLVINSLVGDCMHASWDCVAPFGRFIEIGKRELVDAGKLDMHVFLRNTTFSAFDLSDLFSHQEKLCHDTLRSLVSEVLQSYRAGLIEPVPHKVFPVSDLVQAYRYFSSKDRIGKVVISLEDDKAPIPVRPSEYSTIFDSNKVYLLVGCLGGLGRSLSRWMLARGARRLLFLGRSGCDKPSAKDLVSRLTTAGAHITVMRGDVSKPEDVAKAVSMCKSSGKPIGGVVQAAMGLNESVFADMSNDAWHTGIQPKWQGTLNLHNALQTVIDSLEFFLMMSSVSGTIGTATESNYCAGNSFLDAFAYYLRVQGLPAISVGLGMISEVGYLHENPEIEALLMRRGIQPLSEAEFLQVIDLALAENRISEQAQTKPWSGHILTGLEPLRARRLMEHGFDVSHGVMDDPRASILTAMWEVDQRNRTGQENEQADFSRSSEPWFKALTAKAAGGLLSECNAPSLRDALLRLVRKRFSNLLLVPVDQIEDNKPLTKFGIDSMIASEFRTWIWTTLRLEIPLLGLMDREKTLALLSEDMEAQMVLQAQDHSGSSRS